MQLVSNLKKRTTSKVGISLLPTTSLFELRHYLPPHPTHWCGRHRTHVHNNINTCRLQRRQTRRHGASPAQVDISTHLFAHVNTAGHDGFDRKLMNSRMIFSPEGWSKKSFRTAVSGCVHSNFPWKKTNKQTKLKRKCAWQHLKPFFSGNCTKVKI